MTYLVTARKWRPQVFEDVVGQAHVTTTLSNAISTGRLSHAYILSGPRGVGKTTTARILAKAINCLQPQGVNPDNRCELCVEITEGRSLNVFEIDGASNRGVDEIRNLREAVRYGPAKGKYKVYIIDEVHMLTKEAFNALLKTLEEPPSHVVFIFATTEIHKVPLTILSRCQRFDFRRVQLDEIVARLRLIATEEKVSITDDALFLIARRSDGALRDAQSMFDQVVSYCGTQVAEGDIMALLNLVDDEVFFRTTDLVRMKDSAGMLALVEDIVNRGYDLREYLHGLIEHIRNLLVTATTGSTQLVETSAHFRKRYSDDSRLFSATDLLRLIRILTETDAAMRWSQQPRYRLEIALMQMVKLDSSVEIGQLLREIDEVKKKVNGEDRDPNAATRSNQVLNTKAEAPVRGNVKASQPTLRPEQTVPAAAFSSTSIPSTYQTPSATGILATMTARETATSGHQTRLSLSADEALMKWVKLIQEARTQRIAVGTMLSETSLIEVRENNLRVACPDEFHLQGLARNRQFIQELAQQIYGAKIKLETIIENMPAPPVSTSAESQTPSNSGEKFSERPDIHQHPIVQALVREFNAREIQP